MNKGAQEDGKAADRQQAQAYPPLTGLPLAVITFALPLAAFMQVLDTTIANVAVPTIAGNLGASATQGTWAITSYAITNAIFLPISGWLARRFGEVRVFSSAAALFGLSSLLCGMATTLEFLVAFRVVQGAVAAPMLPLAQSLLLNNYPAHKRYMAIACWSMTVSVAPICGPIIGGWISDNCYWGWIFYINVPVAALVVFLAWSILGRRETVRVKRPVSYVGLSLLVIGMGSLQIMLDRGKELDWFNSNTVVTLAVISLVALTFLVIWELTDENPVVDLRMFASRNFAVTVLCATPCLMAFFGTTVLLPLLLQTQFGYTATLAGLAAAPVGLLQIVLLPLYGRYAKHFDLRVLITGSFLVFGACMYTRTWFSPDMDIWFVLTPQFAQGLANMLFFPSVIALAFSTLRPDQIARGASLYYCCHTTAAAIGSSVVVTMWERRAAIHHTRLAEHIDIYNPIAREALETLRHIGMDELQSAKRLAMEINRQGFILAANEIYWGCMLLFLALIAVIWTAKPVKQA